MPETINASKARPVASLTLEQIKGAMGKEVLARPKLSIGDVAAMLGVGPRTLSPYLQVRRSTIWLATGDLMPHHAHFLI